MTRPRKRQAVSDSKKSAWEESYSRGENHVFWPCDDMVRFVSRYLRRRVGLDEVVDVLPGARRAKVIDVGCGVGRNLIFGLTMGLDMYGIELSATAADKAREWIRRSARPAKAKQVETGDIRRMPWPDAFFDHALSDSALDSMHFTVARDGVREVIRVLKPGGLFYCNLIAGDSPKFDGESIIRTLHERNTIQSYFNRSKIDDLFSDGFDLLQCHLTREEDHIGGAISGRWHLVLKKKEARA